MIKSGTLKRRQPTPFDSLSKQQTCMQPSWAVPWCRMIFWDLVEWWGDIKVLSTPNCFFPTIFEKNKLRVLEVDDLCFFFLCLNAGIKQVWPWMALFFLIYVMYFANRYIIYVPSNIGSHFGQRSGLAGENIWKLGKETSARHRTWAALELGEATEMTPQNIRISPSWWFQIFSTLLGEDSHFD